MSERKLVVCSQCHEFWSYTRQFSTCPGSKRTGGRHSGIRHPGSGIPRRPDG